MICGTIKLQLHTIHKKGFQLESETQLTKERITILSEAKKGSSVKVHYTGKRKSDGSVFDSSEGKEPLEFKLGEGQLIPGFEEAVEGMKSGESNTVTIPSDQAYGEPKDDLVVKFERDRLPEDIQPEVGQQLQLQHKDGNNIPVVITDLDENEITLDANHPLAGEDLIFEIEVVDIQ